MPHYAYLLRFQMDFNANVFRMYALADAKKGMNMS